MKSWYQKLMGWQKLAVLVVVCLVATAAVALPVFKLQNAQLIGGTASKVVFTDANGVLTTTGTIGASTISSAAITDGVIVNADINASAAIAKTKLAAGTAFTNKFLVAASGTGTNKVYTYRTFTYDGREWTRGAAVVVTNTFTE